MYVRAAAQPIKLTEPFFRCRFLKEHTVCDLHCTYNCKIVLTKHSTFLEILYEVSDLRLACISVILDSGLDNDEWRLGKR